MDILWQTACMVVYSIMVDNFASLFNCKTVGRLQTNWQSPLQFVVIFVFSYILASDLRMRFCASKERRKFLLLFSLQL